MSRCEQQTNKQTQVENFDHFSRFEISIKASIFGWNCECMGKFQWELMDISGKRLIIFFRLAINKRSINTSSAMGYFTKFTNSLSKVYCAQSFNKPKHYQILGRGT